jgi:hypothetical protein
VDRRSSPSFRASSCGSKAEFLEARSIPRPPSVTGRLTDYLPRRTFDRPCAPTLLFPFEWFFSSAAGNELSASCYESPRPR